MLPILFLVHKIQNKAGELGTQWSAKYGTPTAFSWNGAKQVEVMFHSGS